MTDLRNLDLHISILRTNKSNIQRLSERFVILKTSETLIKRESCRKAQTRWQGEKTCLLARNETNVELRSIFVFNRESK